MVVLRVFLLVESWGGVGVYIGVTMFLRRFLSGGLVWRGESLVRGGGLGFLGR